MAHSNQTFGGQLGLNAQISRSFILETNIGTASTHWDIQYGDLFVMRQQERMTYVEAFVVVPVLRKWLPKGNLRTGIGYIGSRGTFEYPELAVIRNNSLESNTVNSVTSYLHEAGMMLDYQHDLSPRLVAYASCALSTSINRNVSYQSVVEAHHASGGVSRSLNFLEERYVTRYRLSLGLGYRF